MLFGVLKFNDRLGIMIAESRREEKEMMVSIICNCI